MKLENIEFKNMGPYYSKNKIKLDFLKDKDLTIFIGKNGDGKTSLLNIIKLGLLGFRYFENITKKTTTYYNHLKEFINSRAFDEKKEALINIEFKIENNFKEDIIRIERKFTISPLKEQTIYYLNNKKITNTEIITFEEYLYSNITKEFIEFFIFDAENVYSDVTVANTKIYLSKILDVIFNIEDYKKLIQSLKEYKKILMQNDDITSNEGHYNLLIKENERLKESINKCKKNSGNILDEQENVNGDIEALKEKYKEVTGKELEFNIKGLLNNYQKDKKDLDSYLKSIVQDDLPLLWNLNKLDTIKTGLEKGVYQFINNITKESYFDDDLGKKIRNVIKSELTDKVNLSENFTFNHKLYKNITELKQKYKTETFNEVKIKLTQFIENNKNNKSLLDINNLKSKEEVKTIIKDIEKNVEKYKDLNKKQDNIQNEITYNKEKLSNVVSETTRVLKSDRSLERLNDSIVKATNHITIIEELIYVIKSNAIVEISDLTLKTFKKINRKSNFIDKIIITNNFELKTYVGNQYIKLDRLSAGERQLLFISMIYSIYKLTNLKGTFVVDSFFGKLDTDHVQSVIKYLLPDFGEKRIILNTDKEYDSEFKKNILNLEKSIYKISYDEENKLSNIKEVK